MKKRGLIACIGALVLSFTSCTKDEHEWKDTNVEMQEFMKR